MLVGRMLQTGDEMSLRATRACRIRSCDARFLLLAVPLWGCDGGGPDDLDLVDVRINELVASNATGLMDESGAFPDWLELYNAGNDEADLSGYTLTDDPAEPQKWAFPAGTVIPGGDFLIVFADADPSTATEVHTSWRLSAAGETVQLVGPPLADLPILDEVVYPAMETDVAWAFIDGGFENDSTPTPGEPNE
jgi:hypothetical protein